MQTISLAMQLATARLRTRQGSALLDTFAVIAFTVTSWLTLTTLGGFYMFWQRARQVSELTATDPANFSYTYVLLASIALALLVIPLFSVGMAAARLGAQGRVKRLASLRLIGMSAWKVQKISLVETIVQYLFGFLLGFALYLAVLPVWHTLSFNNRKIGIFEMLLPWWAILTAFAILGILAAIATLLGLVQVSISPLGVARRISEKSLRWWRFAVLTLAICFAITVFGNISPQYLNDERDVLLLVAAAIALVIAGISIAGPLFIQITARFGLLTNKGAKLLAARRVIDNPRAAWRNVSAPALIGLIASLVVANGFITVNTNALKEEKTDTIIAIIKHDVILGVLIVFSFTLILGAVSTLIQQASDVFDRAPEQRALMHIGAPFRVFAAARFRQVMWPYTITTILAVAIGMLPNLAYRISQQKPFDFDCTWLLIMTALGTAITLFTVLLVIPIERQVLTVQARRND